VTAAAARLFLGGFPVAPERSLANGLPHSGAHLKQSDDINSDLFYQQHNGNRKKQGGQIVFPAFIYSIVIIKS